MIAESETLGYGSIEWEYTPDYRHDFTTFFDIFLHCGLVYFGAQTCRHLVGGGGLALIRRQKMRSPRCTQRSARYGAHFYPQSRAEGALQTIWQRLLPHLTRDDLFEMRPFGFGNEGTWQPTGVNAVIRFTR